MAVHHRLNHAFLLPLKFNTVYTHSSLLIKCGDKNGDKNGDKDGMPTSKFNHFVTTP